MSRTLPNIIITGTPGTGKTSHSELLAERTGLRHISVNEVVKDKECHEGWDDEFQSWIVDEDKVGFTFLFVVACGFFSSALSLTHSLTTYSLTYCLVLLYSTSIFHFSCLFLLFFYLTFLDRDGPVWVLC
jgi:hypothetical protein